MTAEPGPADDLRTALAGLARDTARRPLLVALDFDGTLAPLISFAVSFLVVSVI